MVKAPQKIMFHAAGGFWEIADIKNILGGKTL